MIVTPKEDRNFLSINCEEYKKMEANLLSSHAAARDDSNRKIPAVSTLDGLTEIQDANKRMEAAKQQAYDSFRVILLKLMTSFNQETKKKTITFYTLIAKNGLMIKKKNIKKSFFTPDQDPPI